MAEYGFDKIQLTTVGDLATAELNKSKLNEYEPVIVEDSSNLIWKDSTGTIKSVNNTITYDAIADLQSVSIGVGHVVEILGYYTKGDGAGHRRIIADTDDGSGVQVASGKWANLIYSEKIRIEWLGAKSENGFDNSEFFSKLPSVKKIVGEGVYEMMGNTNFENIEGYEGCKTVLIYNDSFFNNISDTVSKLIMKNIDIKKLGDRLGGAGGTSQIFFGNTTISVNNDCIIRNVSFRSLTDINDDESYMDNITKTRYSAFLRVDSLESVEIKNLKTYGVGLSLKLDPLDEESTLKITDCYFYNAETCIWDSFNNIYISNCHVKNDIVTNKYWIGIDIGTDRNGKDLILHYDAFTDIKTNGNIIKDCSATFPIERILYYQASGATISNMITYEGSAGGAMVKSGEETGDYLKKNNTIINNMLINEEEVVSSGNTPLAQIYAQENCIHSLGKTQSSTVGGTINYSYSLDRNNKNIRIENTNMDNGESFILHTHSDTHDVLYDLYLENINLYNVGNYSSGRSSLLTKYTTPTEKQIDGMYITNINSIYSTDILDADKARSFVDLRYTDNIVVKNCSAEVAVTPFRMDNTTDNLRIYDSTFITADAYNGDIFTDFKATSFDFNIIVKGDRSVTYEVKNLNDNGMVFVGDYIRSANYNVILDSSVGILYNRTYIENIFRSRKKIIRIESKGSIFEGILDADLETVTEITNVGGVFSPNIGDYNSAVAISVDTDGIILLRTANTSFLNDEFVNITIK